MKSYYNKNKYTRNKINYNSNNQSTNQLNYSLNKTNSQRNHTLQRSKSMQSIHLYNHAQTNPKNNKSINLINDMLSTSRNSFHSSSNNFSIPSNAATFEVMLDDMNNTILIQRKKHFNEINSLYHSLLSSVNELQSAIKLSNEKQEVIEQNVMDLRKESNQFRMDIERAKTQTFHNQIEKIYIVKKIDEIKTEIENVEKETRDINYMNIKLNEERNACEDFLKNYPFKIEKLINDKKNLSTAIVMMDKKLKMLKKNFAGYVYQGELFMNEFGKYVEREKKEGEWKGIKYECN